jgi:hypothetical protein
MVRYDSHTHRIISPGRLGTAALWLGVAGLAASAVGYFTNPEQFFFSWLTAFVFWTSIALGALFFVMLHHLVNARWSVVVRRLAENVMATLPFMVIFALPVLLGMSHLYHWSHPEAVATDALLQSKSPFLNPTFFVIRTAGYFLIWLVLYWILRGASLRQDEGQDEALTRRLRTTSAPGMILFALTITFAAFDWLMSLDAHWYSTIFGAYIFAGAVLGLLAFLVLAVLTLQRHDALREVISPEHYHDLGKLLFAFTVFWAYMAFSQYFLIWYGNIPEETIWFLQRGEGTWLHVSLLLVIGHFGVPFFFLFPQPAKRNPKALRFISVWLLVMHWVDLYWIVMPSLHHHGVHLSWIDLACMAGIGGIFVWRFWRTVVPHPLVPVGDPLLDASIHSLSP